ncbi:response regulator [Leptospira idonii]|uniref:Response regulator n=1 Tax=Leptospira idonii TaxID=1193500 RepID=A0A4R9M1I0_9LEPT|nr:response regulator [Leptospira idonii]TGN19685.1 response regulator [Leptospira idonii]
MMVVEERKKINKISIIDDDIIYQLLAKQIIVSTELVDRVIQFYDGEEALHFFETNQEAEQEWPDIIFLDLNMPYVDGWDFLDVFAEKQFMKKKELTIYIVSSSNSLEDKEKAKEYSEVTGYYVKPVLRDDYYAIFSDYLGLN